VGKRTDTASAVDEARAHLEEREVWHRRVERSQSIDRIGQEMGLSRSTVIRRMNAARARVQAETSATVEQWRADRTIERAEVLILACVREVENSDSGIVTQIIDHASIARYEMTRLTALDRKAKLLGTYAVEKVEVSGMVTHVDAKDLELAAMLGVADEVKETANA
jgi:hypothetical protein